MEKKKILKRILVAQLMLYKLWPN